MQLFVEVTFYSGNRAQLPAGGYRPDAAFAGSEEYWGITFLDLPVEEFDTSTPAVIQFTFQERHYEEVAPGQSFAIMEGPHKVGAGTVISVENG